MSATTRFVLLLVASNVFMTVAWYGHLKYLHDRKWYVAAILSWCVALFEYLLQVPANRIGYSELRLDQLKITQEVITLSVFAPFSLMMMKQPVRPGYVWAGICLVAAVYFVYRG